MPSHPSWLGHLLPGSSLEQTSSRVREKNQPNSPSRGVREEVTTSRVETRRVIPAATRREHQEAKEKAKGTVSGP
jgi:hypothetical protein